MTDKVKKVKKYKMGWRPDPPNLKYWTFKAYPEQIAAIPASADLRTNTPAIRDQLTLGACSGFASCGVFETRQRQLNKGQYVIYSPLFTYKEARDLDGYVGDVGATLASAAKSMNVEGMATEKSWPYVTSKVNEEAPPAVHAEADKMKATNYYKCEGVGSTLLTNLKTAIGVLGLPVMMGFIAYNTIFSVGSDGMIPLPGGPQAGGHAVVAVGYSDAKQAVLIMNSWAVGWGMGGFGWLPYAYFLQQLVWDCWIIAAENDLNPPLPPTPTTKTPTTLVLNQSNATPKVGETIEFTATLKAGPWGARGVLPEKMVTIWHTFNGVRYDDVTRKTDVNGEVRLNQKFSSTGTRQYYATFAGDDQYTEAGSGIINVV